MKNKLHIARFVLEAKSPVMIAGGAEDPLLDVLLARDVNGLPMLPATSLAGVLRHRFSEDDANAFFGYQDDEKGAASPLVFTDGLFHLEDDAPRDGILHDRNSMAADEVWKLGQLTSPVHRDHVRLNEHGVVDGDGKFERAAAPTGSRFTFEISQRGNDKALKAVVKQVKYGLFLGGATRSGYGELACIRAGIEKINLRKNPTRYCELAKQDLANKDIKLVDVKPRDYRHWAFTGQIEGPLLIGASSDEAEFDRSYYKETRILWDSSENKIDEFAILPASSIKGALRHRTLYHLCRLGHENAQAALERIFGHANKGSDGQAGLLRFSDVEIPDVTPFCMTHVGLDRFTGGSRAGVLFSDRMIWRPELTFRIEPLKPWPCNNCRKAFRAALDDLKTGTLGIGADWGDGMGVFESLEIPSLERLTHDAE